MIHRRAFLQSISSALLAVTASRLLGQQTAASSSGTGLKDLAAAPVLIGTVADQWQMQDPGWLRLILGNFNLITLGKMKWGYLRPSASGFNFAECDWMTSFCSRHGLAMHGHNLCWNANNPSWLASALNHANAERMLTEHIATVMKRYAGSVSSWDVVNEPVATWMGRADGLYRGPWLDTLGPNYIDIAFHTAREADPKPLRVLNLAHVEQGGSGSDAARTATLRLVEGLMKRNVPVQAIGFESHLAGDYSGGPTPSRIAFIRRLREFGLKILITELDVDDTRLPSEASIRDTGVSTCYGGYLSAILAEAQPSRIIFFSPSDQKNWYDAMRTGPFVRLDGEAHRPGLFDASLKPKAAYASVASALRGYRG